MHVSVGQNDGIRFLHLSFPSLFIFRYFSTWDVLVWRFQVPSFSFAEKTIGYLENGSKSTGRASPRLREVREVSISLAKLFNLVFLLADVR